jgi:hypothetical protein
MVVRKLRGFASVAQDGVFLMGSRVIEVDVICVHENDAHGTECAFAELSSMVQGSPSSFITSLHMQSSQKARGV